MFFLRTGDLLAYAGLPQNLKDLKDRGAPQGDAGAAHALGKRRHRQPPQPYTLSTEPFTLHPAPYTLHHAP